MIKAGVTGFPANSLHTGYAQALRVNLNGFEIF
jgi:hypothetical protein